MKHSHRLTLRIVVLVAVLPPLTLVCCTGLLADSRQAVVAKKPVADRKSVSGDAVLFEAVVRPILKKRCYRCHGGAKQKGELNLSTPAGVMKGSESGAIVVAGKPDESLLYEVLREGMMPPVKTERLLPAEIEVIRKWIAGGAKFRSANVLAESRVTQHDIIPLLSLRCTVCHGLRRREGGLDLRTKASMLTGGKSGPAMVLGHPEQSLILKRIHAGEMPPRRQVVSVSVKPMAPSEVETLTEWIRHGAPLSTRGPDTASSEPDPLVTDDDRKFWSFRPPLAAAVPDVEKTDRVRNAIDGFVLRKLEQNGLSLSADADRLTLLRRATFDLTGLPPTEEEIDAFLADTSPLAYENLLDRLLASPRYGERWGHFWLDVAGYSDSQGIQHADVIRPFIYRYRDYVIRSFNADKPYDRFLHEQLAGDELADYENADVVTEEIYDNLVATGFLRLTADGTHANITNFVPDRLKVIDEELEVFSSAVLGLTLKCARCHSHKFDPIPQRDYYRLKAVFQGAYDEHDWLNPTAQSAKHGEKDRYLSFVTTGERRRWEAHNNDLANKVKVLEAKLEEQRQMLTRQHVTARLAKLPRELHASLRQMLATSDDKRTESQKQLAAKYESRLHIDSKELQKIEPKFKKVADETGKRVGELKAQRKPEPLIRALWDRGDPSPTYILKRGNYLTPGRPVGPGVPAVLTDGQTPFHVKQLRTDSKTTGRRLALAHWLTRPTNRLTARVMVNRIWKHHFGTGLVKTLDNFGRAGALPTHPQLLDWLAVEFVRRGWSIKAMHRLMMTSSTYRQGSLVTPANQRLDPENRLLSRMTLRRMDAETLRDTLLFVAGQLDESCFGPATAVEVRSDGLVTSAKTERGRRRSIYVLKRRTQIPTILENFDLPRMNPNCIERSESIVAPQALHLMNNGLVHQLAGQFAKRVRSRAGPDLVEQLARIYKIALGRPPTGEQQQLGLEALRKLRIQWAANKKDASDEDAANQAVANFCHAILNSAPFLYID